MFSEGSQIVDINYRMLFNAIFNILIGIGFNVYYTYGYTEVTQDIKDTVLFKWFLPYIVFSWVHILIKFIEIYNICQYFGESMPKTIWTQLQLMNKLPSSLLKLTYMGALITGGYIMGKFIPYKDCAEYPELGGYYNTCVSFKMIGFLQSSLSLCHCFGGSISVMCLWMLLLCAVHGWG